MMAKRSRAEKEAMDSRAKEIGLHSTMASACVTEEEQDIMLKLQDTLNTEYALEYIVTVQQEENYGDRPNKDREDAIKCLRKLKAYSNNYGDYNLQEALSHIEPKDIIHPQQRRKAVVAREAINYIDATLEKRTLNEAAKQYFKDISEFNN